MKDYTLTELRYSFGLLKVNESPKIKTISELKTEYMKLFQNSKSYLKKRSAIHPVNFSRTVDNLSFDDKLSDEEIIKAITSC